LEYSLIHKPHFSAFEENKQEYIDLMRKVSRDGDWTVGLPFFLELLQNKPKAISIAQELNHFEDISLKYLAQGKFPALWPKK
jgi:hypothetical protein